MLVCPPTAMRCNGSPIQRVIVRPNIFSALNQKCKSSNRHHPSQNNYRLGNSPLFASYNCSPSTSVSALDSSGLFYLRCTNHVLYNRFTYSSIRDNFSTCQGRQPRKSLPSQSTMTTNRFIMEYLHNKRSLKLISQVLTDKFLALL